ncbi:glycosyltransferase family A protein [Fusobacterium ulcerans]|uniref:Glycosyltransferase 2-like domain-containing protein n=1 Tax=Fusobacterium ulcerans 12-1B TaxID=457404 RepID=S2LGJ3_9FUSO|nr:glycosyltransferase family A protein [Fusobacterium ulcerans]EPC09176.1 hypothetical protein HMPREF0402_04090 [Fusobacterium ulcerans 12-1B]
MEKLVSIIVPCFNGEKFIERFLKSILDQTYKKVELIFINDGSTDSTEEIVLSYKKKMEKRGIKFIYISQENKGQAAAINKGLKIFKGEYMTWLDSDDLIDSYNIEKKVKFLEENKTYGSVVSKIKVVSEENINTTLEIKEWKNKNKNNYFEDVILERDILFGGYMVNSSKFIFSNSEREIYESKEGQNWQLLLPILYNYKCGYIDEELYIVVARKNSHSRIKRNFDEIKKRYENFEILLKETLKKIKMDEQEKKYYLKIIEEKYNIAKMKLAFKYFRDDIFNENFDKIKDKKELKLKYRIRRNIQKNIITKTIYNLYISKRG